jgi:hypothetical protein
MYDREEWARWLEVYKLDARTVQRIEFLDDGRFTVYRYATDPDLTWDGVAPVMLDPVTLTPTEPPPPFTEMAEGWSGVGD